VVVEIDEIVEKIEECVVQEIIEDKMNNLK
jgi:hypothetical protein